MMNLGVVIWMAAFAAAFAIVGSILVAEHKPKVGNAFFAAAAIHAIPVFIYLWSNLYAPVERLVE